MAPPPHPDQPQIREHWAPYCHAPYLLAANPRVGEDGLRTALLSSATHLGRPGWNPTFGYGLVNALKTVQYARTHSR